MLEGRFHFHKYSGDNFFPQEASSFLGSFLGEESTFEREAIFGKHPRIDLKP